MDLKSIFGGVSIGRDTSGHLKPSIKGLAVKLTDGTFIARDGDGLFDVGGFVFDGVDKFVYRLPVNEEQIAAGDLLIVSDNPFQALFVKAVKEGSILGLDPQTSSVVEYVPHTNMFGVKFFVKAVSLMDGLASGGATSLLLPLLLLSDGGSGMAGTSDGDSGLTTLLLMQSLSGGQTTDISKLLPLLLLQGNKGGGLESLLLLQALGLNLGNLGAGFPIASPAKPGLPPKSARTGSTGKA